MTGMETDLEATLAKEGWLAIPLPDPGPIFAARDRLLQHLQRSLPGLHRLEDYHTLIESDERHVAVLHDLATFYWESRLGQPIVTANLDLFRRLVGPDLHIQNYPYLRAVRPGLEKDAAPLHRDTYYGASPYEVSIVVPFTEMDERDALRVISGSHLAPDAAYPYSQHLSPDVTIKSAKHQLGFPYAPRLLDPDLMRQAKPVPLTVGQVLIFPLQLVHGGGINTGVRTRFSTDIRIVNSLAPVSLSRGVRNDYFVPLCTSPITGAAQQYLAANAGQSDPVA